MFPYRLSHPELNFNLLNLKKYIYAGEVPPKDMYQLLTVKWEIEPNIAVALIDIYGGHIYDVKEALVRLHSEKENFDYFFDSSAYTDVLQCLNWKFIKKSDNVRMRSILKQLAISGFFPLEDIGDPVAEVIGRNNVGGIIRKSGTTIGLNRQVWANNSFAYIGIVVSKQSMRLVIAEILGGI